MILLVPFEIELILLNRSRLQIYDVQPAIPSCEDNRTLIPYRPGSKRLRGVAELRRHAGRVAMRSLGSEIIPAFLRGRILSVLGARIDRTACVWAGCDFRSTGFELGSHVFLNVGFFFDGVARLTIESNVRVGQFVRVLTGSHEIGAASQRCVMDVIAAPVTIEKGCWIGTGVTIMPGVTVASGCVIAAGAVVTRSTEPDGLYGGVPARRIRDLEAGAASC